MAQPSGDTTRLEQADPRVASFARNKLTIVEPDPSVWDIFVQEHTRGHLLQHTAWGQLKSSTGWLAQRLAVVPKDDPAQLLAGAQVLLRNRYGLSVAYVPRGPLFARDTEVNACLLSALRRTARQQRAVFLRFEPNVLEHTPQANPLHTWLVLNGLRQSRPIQPHSSIHVDLTPEPDAIFAAFSKGHRADIRRAERQGVTIHIGDIADSGQFYAIMQETAHRAAFSIHSEDYYRTAWKLFQPRSRLYLAEQNGTVVAAHLVFADQHCGYYLYSGAMPEGLKSGANHLLEWHALRWARDLGCTAYDMWGIPDAFGRATILPDTPEMAHHRATLEAEAHNDPLIGVYRFKKGFGGRIVRYLPAYDDVYITPLYKWWERRIRS